MPPGCRLCRFFAHAADAARCCIGACRDLPPTPLQADFAAAATMPAAVEYQRRLMPAAPLPPLRLSPLPLPPLIAARATDAATALTHSRITAAASLFCRHARCAACHAMPADFRHASDFDDAPAMPFIFSATPPLPMPLRQVDA